MIYPDGRLQEAGGVIWKDASGWRHGKTGDPRHPRYNFRRETDYCSGACIMLPRKRSFLSLGGFDERYRPAYYEDTDLAFKVREAGLKVIYEPAAEVIHHEGLTWETDTSKGVKAASGRESSRLQRDAGESGSIGTRQLRANSYISSETTAARDPPRRKSS